MKKKIIISFFLVLLAATFSIASFNKNYSGDNMGNCKAKRDVEMRNFDIRNCDGIYASTSTVSIIDMIQILEEPEEHRTGRVFWNPAYNTLSIMSDIPDFTLNVGQHAWVKVRNTSGDEILKGKAVYQSGIQGQLPTVDLAISSDCTKCEVIGVSAENILNNEDGFVVLVGELLDVNTSDFVEGDTLYLSTSTPGGFVKIPPEYPYYAIKVGRVLYSSSTKGKITIDTSIEQTNHVSVNNVDIFGTIYNGDIKIVAGNLTGATTVQSTIGDFTDLYVSTINTKSPLYINNDTNNVLFTGNGRIGIGVVEPAELLDVTGTVKAISFVGDGSALTGIVTSEIDPKVGTLTTNYIPRWSGVDLVNSVIFEEKDAGVIGIGYAVGTGSTYRKLHVHGGVTVGSGNFNRDAKPNGLLVEGNTGIGTDNPIEKLHVVGDIKSSTTVYAPVGDFTDLYVSTGIFSSDILISSRPIANQSWLINLSSTTQITTANSYVVACGTSTLSPDSAWFSLEADINNNFNRLTYVDNYTHKFLVSLVACLSDLGASSSTSFVQIYKNGVGTGRVSSQYYAVQDKIENSALAQVISLSTDDYLEVYFATDDADDLSICQMHLSVVPTD